ncbi:MAG: hypothetical protein KDH15_19895 [Rhodocyclaceae bacterium]|nr:hypothetical protein [Rhodocyclaceae bacterium]
MNLAVEPDSRVGHSHVGHRVPICEGQPATPERCVQLVSPLRDVVGKPDRGVAGLANDILEAAPQHRQHERAGGTECLRQND